MIGEAETFENICICFLFYYLLIKFILPLALTGQTAQAGFLSAIF